METLPEFLDSLAAVGPDAEVIAYAPRERVTQRLSWRDLVEQSRDVAKRLVGLGVQKGTRVGLLCSNRADWLPLAFGILRTGAILVPFSTLWKRDEIAYGLRHGDVEVLLTLPGFLKHDYVAALHDIVPELTHAEAGRLYAAHTPCLRRVVLLEGTAPGMQPWSEVEATVDDAFLDALQSSVRPSDVATIFFTSGTTSQAKAVVHAHGALTISARRLAPCFGITPDDAWWGHMPLFWSGGFVLGAMATLAGRGRIVLQESVDADSAMQLLSDERCTIMAGWHQAGPLLECAGFDRARLALRKGTYHALAERLLGPNHQAIGVYGMSETATCVTASMSTEPEELRVGSFGRPLEGMVVKIVDPETHSELPQGETGEILVKGPTLMEGYYKVPRADTLDGNGFLRTGDLGYFDARGALHFATRLKDVIKTSGVNVAAVEVEETLARHPEVKAAHVVGVPHPVRGETIAAFVVAASERKVDPDDLRRFCRENLASYKVPRHIWFIEEQSVPRTGTGKVGKAELRELARGKVGNEEP